MLCVCDRVQKDFKDPSQRPQVCNGGLHAL